MSNQALGEYLIVFKNRIGENMAIYGIGAFFESDVSLDFISNNIAGTGWSNNESPEIHQYIRSLKVGDIIYIKSFAPKSRDLFIKAIGIILNDEIETNNPLVCIGRNVKWLITKSFRIQKPEEKNNVRSNTIYEEFHTEVQKAILDKIFQIGP